MSEHISGRFVLRGDVEQISRTPGRTASFVSSPRASGSAALVLIHSTGEPGTGHGFHRHPNQEEVLYVLAGEVEAWLEQESRILRSGEAMFVPRDVVHATYTVGSETAQLIVAASPSRGETGLETVELQHEEPWASLRQSGGPSAT